ncbi:guanine nucleotide exchange factor DBS [Diaphorina citri]|uniref:Guanine nucleotide exchange factor DBS n=1 Tax=Diaphorina citri TaxID=121845 RepID=A0A3Q0IQ77_DIACI|nr:guanine nucleotide exchange factor DBS [Diaphorina citri]
MIYICRMQEADMGFVILVDRRNDKWSSVKHTLLRISTVYPGAQQFLLVSVFSHVIEKAISEVSNKFFKEEFKFKLVICSCVEELHQYIDKSELTAEYGGDLVYCHHHWIQQRIALEQFSIQTRTVSDLLDKFTKLFQDSTEEYPIEIHSIKNVLHAQSIDYALRKEEILEAAKRGESLLYDFKSRSREPSSLINITAVERLLVQLEETERTFDEFWQNHSAKMRQLLELRTFEYNFKETQEFFPGLIHIVFVLRPSGFFQKAISEVSNKFFKEEFKFKMTCVLKLRNSMWQTLRIFCITSLSPLPVQPRLKRLNVTLTERLQKRCDTLNKCKELQVRIDKANNWCAQGRDLLASQHIDKCSCSPEIAEQLLYEIEHFMEVGINELNINLNTHNSRDFYAMFEDAITPETKALVNQVLQRIDDVAVMCEKRQSNLRKLVSKPPRPIQTVTPEPGVPLQPPLGAPTPHMINFNKILRKANTVARMDNNNSVTGLSQADLDQLKLKQRHVLTELVETERTYVTELGSIVTGYKSEMNKEDAKCLIPAGLDNKTDILFGNLEEICHFHRDEFLKDLEACNFNIELVALCFTKRKDTFYKLYSHYCQNHPRSENLRELVGENNAFFQSCQVKLGHKLPLAAYLLKPIQRITKYQLLLKDLLHYRDNEKTSLDLQEALDCMLVVLKCVNDSMHQIAITGFRGNIMEQGELLLQGSFSVWYESKKDRLKELRLKPMQRHLFLYQKSILFCKKTAAHTKATYQFKQCLKMSQVGLTETVKGDSRKFELWLQGRQEVYIIQATTLEQKQSWVNEIKRVLLEQLQELRGEKIRQYSANFAKMRQVTSLDTTPHSACNRSISSDDTRSHPDEDSQASSDYSNSDDEDSFMDHHSGKSLTGKYLALADYDAVGHSEVSLKEGDPVELLKVGCAGWWYIKLAGSQSEGWVPASYLEHSGRKTYHEEMEHSEEVISAGESMLRGKHYIHLDSVEPKVDELKRLNVTLTERLQKRCDTLNKCKELQVRIDKANNWCAQGRDLLASQHIDKCSCSPEIAEQLLYEIEHFMEVGINELNINLNTHNSRDFYAMFEDAITPETKALVNQGNIMEQGELLLQGSFSVWYESKKDRLKELRLKPMQRHLFLYQKSILFCKKTAAHTKATYQFKQCLKDLLHYRDNEKTSLDLQEALDCMLVVLKCVNDSMHQIAITGFRVPKFLND